MLQKLITSVLFIFSTVCCVAQVSSPPSGEGKILAYSPTELRFRTPLYVINADTRTLHILPTIKSGDVVSGGIPDINTRWVESIRVVPAQDAVALYGEQGRNGAMIVELKAGIFEKLPAQLAERFTPKK